jgi:hypothetical protein
MNTFITTKSIIPLAGLTVYAHETYIVDFTSPMAILVVPYYREPPSYIQFDRVVYEKPYEKYVWNP